MHRTLGTCYYPEHWPEDIWERDAAQMVEAGLSWVRIGEFAWSRLEPSEGQLMRVVGFGHGQVGQIDLVKAVVVHRPEHIAPCCVQGLRGLIALCQPFAEACAGCIGIADRGVVASVFVISLPRRNIWIGTISFGHGLHDHSALVAVAHVRKTVVAA